MDRPYVYLSVARHGTTSVVHLAQLKYDDLMLDQLGVELGRLLDEEGCRSLILSLGPEDPDCLYSVFLAKLIHIKKRLEQSGGTLLLTDLSDHTRQLLQVAGLERFFTAVPDTETALKTVGR